MAHPCVPPWRRCTNKEKPVPDPSPAGTTLQLLPRLGQPTDWLCCSPADGTVHPEWPQLGPAQPYPTMVTPMDEQLLARLHAMGHTAGADGLPGYPYIGAPYIGVYSADQDGAANEEPYTAAAEDDEVRGTQV